MKECPWNFSQRPSTKVASEQINAQGKVLAAVEFEQGSSQLAFNGFIKPAQILLTNFKTNNKFQQVSAGISK